LIYDEVRETRPSERWKRSHTSLNYLYQIPSEIILVTLSPYPFV